MEGVHVENVLIKNEKVVGVTTNKGDVKCEVFVNCGGQVLCVFVAKTEPK